MSLTIQIIKCKESGKAKNEINENVKEIGSDENLWITLGNYIPPHNFKDKFNGRSIRNSLTFHGKTDIDILQ